MVLLVDRHSDITQTRSLHLTSRLDSADISQRRNPKTLSCGEGMGRSKSPALSNPGLPLVMDQFLRACHSDGKLKEAGHSD
jgi:hypothetical protein